MGTVQVTIPIERPAGDVFDFITDLDRMKSWSARLRETEVLHQEPGGTGSRIRQVYGEGGRGMVTEGEVTVYDPPAAWSLRFTGKNYTLAVEYRIRASERAACELTQTSDLEFTGLMKPLVELLFRMTARKRMITDLAMLKALLENDPPPPR